MANNASNSSELSLSKSKSVVNEKQGTKSVGASSSLVDEKKDEAGFVYRRHHNSIHLNTLARFGCRVETHNWSSLRKQLATIIGHGYFEIFLASLVAVSFIITIVETDHRAVDSEPPDWCKTGGMALLVFYCLDVTIRFFVLRMSFFKSTFNNIDLLIVLVDILFVLLSTMTSDLPSIMFLRVLRLLRLSRAFYIVQSHVELYLMVEGLFGALKTLFYGGCLLGICFSMLGILTTEAIYPLSDKVVFPDTCGRCPDAFKTVRSSIYTFVQTMVLGDEWGSHYLPLFEKYPWTAAVLLPSFIIVHLGLLNLILAVIVDSATQARDRNTREKAKLKEADFQRNKERLQDFCRQMDTDNSLSITIDELLNSFDNDPAFHATLHAMDIGREDLHAVFNILDNDDSGTVEYEEFVDQLYKMKSNDSHTMLVFIKHYVQDVRKKMGDDMLYVRQELRDSIRELHVKVTEEMSLIKQDMDLHLKSLEMFEQKTAGQQKEFKSILQDEEAIMKKELTLLEENIDLQKHLSLSPAASNALNISGSSALTPAAKSGTASGVSALLSKLSMDTEQLTSALQDLVRRCDTHVTSLISVQDSFPELSRAALNSELGISRWTAPSNSIDRRSIPEAARVEQRRAWAAPGCCSPNLANAPMRVVA